MSFVFDFMSVYSFHITFSLAVLQFQNHRSDFAGIEGAQRRSRRRIFGIRPKGRTRARCLFARAPLEHSRACTALQGRYCRSDGARRALLP